MFCPNELFILKSFDIKHLRYDCDYCNLIKWRWLVNMFVTNRWVEYTVWLLWTKGWFISQDGASFYHAAQNDVQLKTLEFFVSVFFFFNSIFSVCGWPQVTKTTESDIVERGDYLDIHTYPHVYIFIYIHTDTDMSI